MLMIGVKSHSVMQLKVTHKSGENWRSTASCEVGEIKERQADREMLHAFEERLAYAME